MTTFHDKTIQKLVIPFIFNINSRFFMSSILKCSKSSTGKRVVIGNICHLFKLILCWFMKTHVCNLNSGESIRVQRKGQ